MIYLISYDLNKEKNYPALYTILKKVTHCHPLESVWLIKTSQSIESLTEIIHKNVDDDDAFFIVDITNQPRSGYLENWECIEKLEE